MKKVFLIILILVFLSPLFVFQIGDITEFFNKSVLYLLTQNKSLSFKNSSDISGIKKSSYWLLLYRKSNIEFLYFGIPGDYYNSRLVKIFRVKSGIPEERPTPLPNLLGREYWVIVDKTESKDNPETAPYFLSLDIPVSDEEPFGPQPYFECLDPLTGKAAQCNWILPGEFGLHGVNGDESRLEKENVGSSGCIRHSDEDIIFLYYLLDPQKEKIRYYIEDF